MPMYLYLGDITRMETDAIVNAAGTDLRRCPGICDAIFAAADTEELERACRKLGRCRIGQAVAHAGLRAALPVHHSRGRAGLVRVGSPGSGSCWPGATRTPCIRRICAVAGGWRCR